MPAVLQHIPVASPYRGRLAPSPTGPLHLGHAQTFLVAWLRARLAKGTLLLRMEDVDSTRAIPGMANAMTEDLRWLGLHWDEGPDEGGPAAPYVQSQCHPFYLQALQVLQNQGHLFACTCSRTQIAQSAGTGASIDGLGLRYPGTCRHRMIDHIDATPPSSHAIRFRFTQERSDFVDSICGPVHAQGWDGDFVLRRADGIWAYQLAVVVDDTRQGITEVVRGADLLTSTPRQRGLHKALGHTPPAFAHVSLVRDISGNKISKHHREHTLAHFRQQGVSPEALIGRIAHNLELHNGAPISPVSLLRACRTSHENVAN